MDIQKRHTHTQSAHYFGGKSSEAGCICVYPCGVPRAGAHGADAGWLSKRKDEGLPWLPVDAFLHLFNCNVTDPSSKHSQFSMTRRPSTMPRVDPIDRPCWYNPSIWRNAEPHLGYSSYSNTKHLRSFPTMVFGACLRIRVVRTCCETFLPSWDFSVFSERASRNHLPTRPPVNHQAYALLRLASTPSTHQTRQHILFKMAIERHRPFRHVRRAQLQRYLSSQLSGKLTIFLLCIGPRHITSPTFPQSHALRAVTPLLPLIALHRPR